MTAPVTPVRDVGATELRDRVHAAGLAHGLDRVGCAGVGAFPEVRRSLEQRRDAGQHAGMSFTFRNPRRSTEPERLLRDARTLVVAARSYLETRPERPVGPVAAVARYAWRDHYAELRAGLDAMADVLRDHGHRAAVFADDNALVDRAAAHRAGIGWWGRNSNLLVPGSGSWFVLGSVVTDAALPTAEQPVADGCRSCTRCLTACPTGAIVADGVIDGRRCLAWLVQDVGVFPREHRIALGDRIYGCDDCQEVCPPGRRDAAEADGGATSPAGGDAPPDAWVSVLEILDPAVSDQDLLDRFGRWYIPRRDPRHLRRNALVVLGNVGDAGDAAQRATLARWCEDDDDLLRAHAVWAAARLGLAELVEAGRDDPSPLVRAEVAMAPAVPPAPGAATPVRIS